MDKHLWEIEHPYYCNEGNYFTTTDRVMVKYKSLADFLAEEGDNDMDLNLLFRWDWEEAKDDDEKPIYNGDPNYRNGILKLFWMGQRKGLYRFSLVEVCRNDEPAVIEFLKKRWGHLRSLWEPLAHLEAK